MKRSAGISGWILVGCIFAAGVFLLCGLLMGCTAAPPLPTPRRISVRIVWEERECLSPPLRSECVEGYVTATCGPLECDCAVHVQWRGSVEAASAVVEHELWHTLLDAMGKPDGAHLSSIWVMRAEPQRSQ